MKTYTAVKTEKRATEILEQWLNDIYDDEIENSDAFGDIVWDWVKVNCDCGETMAKQAFYEAGSKIATVAICHACGDDDAFTNEVLYISE